MSFSSFFRRGGSKQGQIGTLLISRTDGLGDVVLTLPVAAYIKSVFPGIRIVFLGSNYTRAVATACGAVDLFVDWTALSSNPRLAIETLKSIGVDAIIHVFPRKSIAQVAKKAGIPIRIGTSHRWYHWFTCNRLVGFNRKNSELHEAQLNFKLLTPILTAPVIPTPDEMARYLSLAPSDPLPDDIEQLIDPSKVNIILHPKSKGSAREWGEENFGHLIELLPAGRYKVFITGSEAEGERLREWTTKYSSRVTDLTGKLSLSGLIAFIARCQALIACSTGPLHIASALGIQAIGIYPPIRPMHPGRWAPIGRKVKVFVQGERCNDCRKSDLCHCILSISPKDVSDFIIKTLP